MLFDETDEYIEKFTAYDRSFYQLVIDLFTPFPESELPQEVLFEQSDVRSAMERAKDRGWIKKVVANIPDIKYTYDARRDFPKLPAVLGHLIWLQNGKGKYKLVRSRRPNIIRLPEDLAVPPATQMIADQTPPLIAALLGQDEQAVFTRVRNAGVISTFFDGLQPIPIQGHHRTTVKYGQIEVDEVQAYQNLDDEGVTVIPISGKGGNDKLSWSQALNLNVYGAEKHTFPVTGVRSLGLWRDEENTVWIVEFTPETDIEKIEIKRVKRYRFR